MEQEIEKYIKEEIKEKYENNPGLQVNPTAYFWDLAQIKDNINIIERYAPEQLSLYYAIKANKDKDILSTISEHKFIKGLETASIGELDIALKYVNADRILFTGPGKTQEELYHSVKSEIRFINVESLTEAHRIDKIAEKLGIDKVNILLRINTNFYIDEAQDYMAGKSTKMGIDERNLSSEYREILNLKHINICGIHVFSASGIMNYEALIRYVNYVFGLVQRIENEFYTNIDVIDFGGGLGIDYSGRDDKFNVRQYFKLLEDLIKAFKFDNKELIMELGTFLVGNAGYYTAKIIDIKESKGKKHMILAGGVNHSGLQLEMQRKHPVCILSMNEPDVYRGQPSINNELCDISGPCCMCNDILSWDTFINNARMGDICIFLQSGAYCYEEAMINFLSHPEPYRFTV